MRRRSWFTSNPVAVKVRSQLASHRIFPQPASNQSRRRDDQIKDETQNNSRIDPAKDVSDPHPSLMRPRQSHWKYCRGQYKRCRYYQRPPPRILATKNKRPDSQEGKYPANQETERPQLLRASLISHRYSLSQAPSPWLTVRKL